MPGRPVLAAVFSCRSLTRECSRPLMRDFQAWGPSSIITRMPRTAAEVVQPAGQNIGVHRAGGDRSRSMEGMISQAMGVRPFLSRADRWFQRSPGPGRELCVLGWRLATARVGTAPVQYHDAQVGPAAGCEIDGEDGHGLTLRLALIAGARKERLWIGLRGLRNWNREPKRERPLSEHSEILALLYTG